MEMGTETYTPQVNLIKDQNYEGRMIAVDNHLYERCRFVDCNFLYSGGPFGFANCEVQGGYLSPSGAARNALSLLAIFRELEQQTKGPY